MTSAGDTDAPLTNGASERGFNFKLAATTTDGRKRWPWGEKAITKASVCFRAMLN
jgi:hypothetical protein